MAPSSRVTAALAATLALLIVIGGGTAYTLGQPTSATAGQAVAGVSIPRVTDDATADTFDGHTAPSDDAGGGHLNVRGTPEIGGGTGESATMDVIFSPRAAAWPRAEEVDNLLQRYFAAINALDYDAWLATVSTSQALRDRVSWEHDYSTTTDVDIYVTDIEQSAAGIDVRMQFTSYQDIEFAPADLPEECVRWDVTYHIIDEGIGLRVDLSAEPPTMAPCD